MLLSNDDNSQILNKTYTKMTVSSGFNVKCSGEDLTIIVVVVAVYDSTDHDIAGDSDEGQEIQNTSLRTSTLVTEEQI